MRLDAVGGIKAFLKFLRIQCRYLTQVIDRSQMSLPSASKRQSRITNPKASFDTSPLLVVIVLHISVLNILPLTLHALISCPQTSIFTS